MLRLRTQQLHFLIERIPAASPPTFPPMRLISIRRLTAPSPWCAALLLLALPIAQPNIVRAESGHSFRTDDTVRIVILGSSTAKGQGASRPDSCWVRRYRRVLGEASPATQLVNLSVPGYTTYHFLPLRAQAILSRPLPDSAVNITHALSLHPSALVINLPTNDAAYGFDTTEQIANYRHLVTLARGDSIPVWVCTPQPRNLKPEKRRICQQMREWIIRTYGLHAIDFWSGLAAADGTLKREYDSGDGTHLNDAGHRLLFERIVAADIPAVVRAVRAARSSQLPARPDSLRHGRVNGTR